MIGRAKSAKALSSLTKACAQDDIRDTMLNQLDSANMGDLPVIMRFLLQTATVDTIEEVYEVLFNDHDASTY